MEKFTLESKLVEITEKEYFDIFYKMRLEYREPEAPILDDVQYTKNFIKYCRSHNTPINFYTNENIPNLNCMYEINGEVYGKQI